MNTNPTDYAHPEALVDTDWLEQHLNDKDLRIVESNEDILLYDTGHIPGAVHIDWRTDLQDQVIRDYIAPDKFAELCRRNGIATRHNLRFLRRQSQLVGLLCPLGLPAFRPREREDPQWRPR